MQVGDLVRRAETIDPRVGIVQHTFMPHPDGKLCCVVLWSSGDTGHYFDTCLEVLCETGK